MYAFTKREHVIHVDGRTIYGQLYLPDAPGKRPAFVASHGFNGSHAHYDTQCAILAEHGFVAYAFDFCGGAMDSRSSGKPTEMTVFTERRDLMDVIAHVRALEPVDGGALFAMGGSQGGLVTALAAEARPDSLRALALFYPAFNIPGDWRHAFPDPAAIPETIDFWHFTLGRDYCLSLADFNAYDHIGGFAGPVLMMTGEDDAVVRPDVVRRAAVRYADARLVLYPGEGHGFSEAGVRDAMRRVLEMANACLGAQGVS